MELLSLIGIFVGLSLMILLTYRGHSIIWVAPVCAFVVVLFSVGAGLGEGRTLMSAYTVDYMQGAGNYFISWFPVFLLGAIYGKVMDITGAAKSLANVIIGLLGEKLAVLAVLIPCLILTYGGVSLFVVVFIVYPMGYEIYKAADLPRIQLPLVIVVGSVCITMTAVPGTPQIQNLIPMEYFGTTATAGALMGIVYSVIVIIPQYLYVNYKAKKAKAAGIGFGEDLMAGKGAGLENGAGGKVAGNGTGDGEPSWHWLSGLVPLLVVFAALNLFKINVIVALILGIVVCCLFNIKKIKVIPMAISEGAKSSVTAMMNTACAVGFGSVIRIVPGFMLLTALLIGNADSVLGLLFSESASVAVLSGATGSASGGISIALEAFGDQYMAVADNLGLSPEILHRVAVIAAGALDKLPHNGALITLLTVCQCSHKDSYKDIFVVAILIQIVALAAVVLVWSFI